MVFVGVGTAVLCSTCVLWHVSIAVVAILGVMVLRRFEKAIGVSCGEMPWCSQSTTPTAVLRSIELCIPAPSTKIIREGCKGADYDV